ncbi:MAG: ABC transporter permease [Gemmatimonas sp.]
MLIVLQELRLAARSLRRNPVFTSAALLSLALGIGANTAIFSIVNGVLLRPAPFADLDRIAMVWETDRTSGTTREPASIPDFTDFQSRSRQFERLAAFSPIEVNASQGDSDPERLAGISVSHGYFETLGLKAFAGRTFTASEDRVGGPITAVISEELWARLYQRDRSVLGRSLRLNGVDTEIIGVMPSGSDFGVLQVLGAAAYNRGFAERGGRPRVDVWIPLRASPEAPRDNHPIFVLGRLAGASSIATAQFELTAITADLERSYPDANRARGAFIEPLDAAVFGSVRPALLVLVAAVAMVLLVACANVANLMLARAASRAHEVTVRSALGASTARLMRQFMVEGFVLVGTGAILGTLLALAGVTVLRALAPATIPRIGEVGLDLTVLAVTAGIAVLIALGLGILPALHARRANLQSAMVSAGGRGSAGARWAKAFRSSLVVAELAIATTLMVGAGLLIRSLWTLQSVDPGFTATSVLKAEFELPDSRYPRNFAVFPNWPERQRFQMEVAARLGALPGVESVALATANPMDAGFTSSIRVVGREAEAVGWPEPSIRTVSANYFSTLRVPMRAGRVFEATDQATSGPVVILNESARARFFAERDPLGAQINLWGAARTVVGVVGNERFKGLANAAPPAVYLPLTQAPMPSAVLVRMSGDAALAVPLVRRVIREIDPQLALFGVEPLSETISGTMSQRRFTMLVLAVFAFAALVLAVIGVHGVLSYAVAQRTREIGIRVALGADLARVRRLILSEGVRLAATGVGLGLVGAFALARVMRALVFGVGAYDPVTFVGVATLLGGIALIACWLPARQAARVDPIVALRSE